MNGQPSEIRHISLTFFLEMDVFYIDNIPYSNSQIVTFEHNCLLDSLLRVILKKSFICFISV